MSASIRLATRMTGAWTSCNRQREHVEKFGLTLDMVQLPLSSRPIEEAAEPACPAGQGSGAAARARFDLPADRADRCGGHSRRRNTISTSSASRAPRTRPDAADRAMRRSAGVTPISPRRLGVAGHGERGGELGAHRHIPRRGGAGGRGGEGAAGVPSARPLHAARLQGRHARTRHGGGTAALRDDARKPVSRAEFLPRHGGGDAR